MAKRVYLYAFDPLYKIVCCVYLEGDAISVRNMVRFAEQMEDMTSPTKLTVYAIDNRPGLFRCFQEAMKSNDFADRVAFADFVGREGILIR